MAVHEQCEVRLPSDTSAGLDLQNKLVSRLEQLSFPPRDVFGVRLSLEEALINAIKHGNKLDPNKSVRVKWLIEDNLFEIEIEDEGTGFKPEMVPDCTQDENLERPSGRGIMLMKAFMTQVEYRGRGNILFLQKRRTGENAA